MFVHPAGLQSEMVGNLLHRQQSLWHLQLSYNCPSRFTVSCATHARTASESNRTCFPTFTNGSGSLSLARARARVFSRIQLYRTARSAASWAGSTKTESAGAGGSAVKAIGAAAGCMRSWFIGFSFPSVSASGRRCVWPTNQGNLSEGKGRAASLPCGDPGSTGPRSFRTGPNHYRTHNRSAFQLPAR
jgi:hypothetical protein